MKRKTATPNPHDRLERLKQAQRLKMARSAHAYVRGNTAKFYEWLESANGTVPQGPAVWICGDCHAGNLGPVADADGRVEIEIRDLDQTVIGNPAHDLIRLGLSLATAVRGSDLPGVTTARMLEEMMLGYDEALSGRRGKPAMDEATPVKVVLKQALNRKWRHLAAERIEDVKPTIPLGKNFWALSLDEKKEIARIFETEDVRRLVTSLRGRKDDEKIEVLDAAYWRKGCSSLGRLRYAVLVGVGKSFCLVDIKEAVHTAAPSYKTKPGPRDHAQRVVDGARALSPFLGERMLAAKFGDTPVVLRELRPQDLKLDMDQLTQDEVTASARFLSGVVGRAHGRQMDAATKKKWRAELGKDRGKLDAPSWLWTSVVDLIASHEVAYLEHCRRYALGV